jgi:hypothetical protein
MRANDVPRSSVSAMTHTPASRHHAADVVFVDGDAPGVTVGSAGGEEGEERNRCERRSCSDSHDGLRGPGWAGVDGDSA